MKTRLIGESGVSATVVGLGAWAIGGWSWGGTDEADSIAAIQASLDAGITLVDTAPAYGMGRSEEIVGKAIKGRRDQVILSSKCGLVWHTQNGNHFFDQDGKPVHRYLGEESVRYEVEQSLKRLNTDYLDVYFTHWQDPTTPIEETMTALMKLKEAGKIRAIGVSNINVEQLEAYEQVGKLDVAQEQYSMIDRDLEADVLPYTQAHNIAVMAYSPLALGLLTGKIGPERSFEGDDHRIDNPRFTVENRQRVAAMLAAFQPVADKHDLTMAQLVIAWTAAQPGITHVLVGARNTKQALENARAGSVALDESDLQAMNDVIAQHAAAVV
ncbi:MAG: aldo/keto reductase [Anaerolineaceae bacterium]|nr:aldo/keto reductase [Anaerolineaceae bacterium]